MTEDRYLTHFTRPLWDSLALADEDPYGGLFGSLDDMRRGLRICRNCGAYVADRGLHYRFHVQLTQMFDLLKIQAEREVLATFTSEDEDAGMEPPDA